MHRYNQNTQPALNRSSNCAQVHSWGWFKGNIWFTIWTWEETTPQTTFKTEALGDWQQKLLKEKCSVGLQTGKPLNHRDTVPVPATSLVLWDLILVTFGHLLPVWGLLKVTGKYGRQLQACSQCDINIRWVQGRWNNRSAALFGLEPDHCCWSCRTELPDLPHPLQACDLQLKNKFRFIVIIYNIC